MGGGGGESENMAMTPAALLHVDNYFLVSKQVKKEKEKNNKKVNYFISCRIRSDPHHFPGPKSNVHF